MPQADPLGQTVPLGQFGVAGVLNDFSIAPPFL